jgi:2'-5' RNA ligase
MHRLFVAIRPPAAVRAQLLSVMHGVRGARWQEEDQLHLTLRFIGEVDRHAAEDVAAALGSIHRPSFAVRLNGVGSFDRRGKGALWAGIAPHEELKSLHNKVDQACRKVGIGADTRAYLPHITLARLNRSSGPIEPFVEGAAGLRSSDFEVDSFCLYESHLKADGPIYTIVERYPLEPK